MDEDEDRPSCNCKKNQCLKGYCHCFVHHWFCTHACNCEDCLNRENKRFLVEEYAELRLNTKPSASQLKIASDGGTSSSRHVKGCTCNKSGCKKNYCECFKKQAACTASCKCQGCENSHGTGGKGLQENGDSGGSSVNSNSIPDGGDGSPGNSIGSVVVTGEESVIGDPQDSGTPIHEASTRGHDDVLHSLGGIGFHQNAHPQRNQASMHVWPLDNVQAAGSLKH